MLLLGRGRVLPLGFVEGGGKGCVVRYRRWRLLVELQRMLDGLEVKDEGYSLRRGEVWHEEWELGWVKFDLPF